MPPRKYAPDDPRARRNLAKKAHVDRYPDKRRKYERDLRARQRAANDGTHRRRVEYQEGYRERARALANAPGVQQLKYEQARAKLLADPDRRAADLAKRAKAYRFKTSGLSPELFDIKELNRDLKRLIADGSKRAQDGTI